MTDKERLARYEKFLNKSYNLWKKCRSNYSFTQSLKLDASLLNRHELVVKQVLEEINKAGIDTYRPNEAGNKAEECVRLALEENAFSLDKLSQNAGYPDILILDDVERPTYLEVKTFNIKTVNSTLRSFFISPPKKKSKIEFDARHLLVAFELERKNAKFYAEKASLYDITFLIGEIKREFNTSNQQLYASPYSKELFSVLA